jgi:hypothetical protein
MSMNLAMRGSGLGRECCVPAAARRIKIDRGQGRSHEGAA